MLLCLGFKKKYDIQFQCQLQTSSVWTKVYSICTDCFNSLLKQRYSNDQKKVFRFYRFVFLVAHTDMFLMISKLKVS